MTAGLLADLVLVALLGQVLLLAAFALRRNTSTAARAKARRGDWSGWRRFIIERVAPEDLSGSIRSFYLRPVAAQSE